jgi:hypothetical protein
MDYTDHVVDKVRDAVRQHARVSAPDDDRGAVACWRWPDIAVLAVLTLLTASLIVLA